MRLTAGARLGPYEIVAPLGAGGMGEVYKARDTRLGRDVAVKVLSPDIASSAEARQRFEREARTISQLSHPHICALFDVGEAPNPQSPIPNPYLVMELLDGETLAQRLTSGPLPLDLTLRYAVEIADALDAAHRQGIAHRDLKPANVMVTKSGIKLLDFGLARAVEPLFHSSRSIVETEAAAQLTAEGTVTGTLQYMAPEQLEGRPADTRSDIFAFGAMLYEMATGKKAFSAGSPVALASAILHAQPPAMTSVDGALPAALDRIVRTCLAKDPDQRWQSARDVELQLRVIADSREGVASSPSPPAAVGGRRGWIRWAPWGVAAAALIVSAVTVALRPGRVATRPSIVKFLQQPPPGGAFFVGYENTGLSISPDGTQIAFSARDASGIYRIWLRPVGALEAAALPGTDGPTSMFWSPDGRSLAFFTASKLRRVDLPGGAPVSICDVREGIGFSGTWGADGQILFASIEGEAIYGVAASGGVPAPVLKPDPKRNEARLNWPFFLPDGRRFLYLQRARDGNGHLTLAEPGRAPREVMPVQASVQYVEPGYLVFVREGALVGQRFDASRGTVMGAPFSIADRVSNFLSTTVARFATSASGSLVYQSHDEEQRLAWFDRGGRELGMVGPSGQYKNPRISPDDRRVAFDRLLGGAFDVWEADLERGGETRLTFGVSSEGAGPWTADGRALFFNADQGAPPVILRKNLTTGTDEPVVPPSGTMQEPHDISPDGRTLLYTQRGAGGDHIWVFALDGSHTPVAAFNTPFEEFGVRFSRDGRYFSYASAPSGRSEIYVSPFPPTGEKAIVSPGGGFVARWSRDGRELLYLSAERRLMSIPIQTSPSLRVGTPVPLFEIDRARSWSGFDVTTAGRFLAVVSEKRANEQPMTVVLNWTAALDR